MASQGPLSPASVVSDAGNGGVMSWISPGSVSASDNAYATVSLTNASPVSDWLLATSLGFSIPSGATIDGIVVEIERHEDAISNDVFDVDVLLSQGGVIAGTNKASTVEWDTALNTYFSYGGIADLWGRTTWTPTNVNATNFGVALSVQTLWIAATAYVDHIRITVYYTVGGAVAYQERVGTFDPHMTIKAWF